MPSGRLGFKSTDVFELLFAELKLETDWKFRYSLSLNQMPVVPLLAALVGISQFSENVRERDGAMGIMEWI